MKILSLFNGISGLHCAFDRAGIKVDTCYYSEIDKYANKVTEKHYPNDIALGDVTKWREWNIDWSEIGFVGAGFPCQAWSVAGKQLGDKDERGMLFWTTLEIIAHVLKHNPSAKFLMENVKMKKDFEQYITHHTEQALGKVEKTLINSALVSAQNRQRYYWTNFEVSQPDDKGILLKDILEQDSTPIYKELESDIRSGKVKSEQFLNGESQTMRRALANGKSPDQKANTLTSCAYKGMGTNGMTNVVVTGGAIRGRYIVDGKRQDHKMKTAGLTEQRLEVCNDGKTNTLTTVQKDNVAVYRPASIVGRRLNERGVRDDYNKSVPITQCLQVKHRDDKTGCLTTVEKDNVLSTEPAGRYPDIYNRYDIHYRKLTPLECERLQTFPDNWTAAIEKHIYCLYNYKEAGKKEDLDLCDVKLMAVKGMQEQKNKVTCALCTTSDLLDLDLLIYQRLIPIKMKSVNIVIEQLEKKEVELEECVVDITKTGLDIRTLYMQIKSSLNLGQAVTKNELMVKTYTGKLLRIISAESCQEMRLFTILIAIKLITQLRICMYVKDRASIHYCIDSLKESQGNLLSVVLSSLRMEATEQTVSNTQRYKALGNAWCVDVIVHILKCMVDNK